MAGREKIESQTLRRDKSSSSTSSRRSCGPSKVSRSLDFLYYYYYKGRDGQRELETGLWSKRWEEHTNELKLRRGITLETKQTFLELLVFLLCK